MAQLHRRDVNQVTPADLEAADQELAGVLDELDGAANYAAWIHDLIEPHLGSNVVEIGAGHGTFTQLMATPDRQVCAQDLSPRCVELLRERFATSPNVTATAGDLASLGGEKFDSAVLINVLEHIEGDDVALDQLRDLLAPGGRLVLWVPAFQQLYADFDRRVGHHRRYRREVLCAQLSAHGFDIAEARYVNAVGGIAWLVIAKWLRRTPTQGLPLRIFDGYMIPVLRVIEEKVRLPFGQSLLVVATKPQA